MTSTASEKKHVEELERELSRLREEIQEVRADRAVRRLFLHPADEVFSPEDFFRDTGIRFRGDRFVALEFEDDPRFPPARPREDSPASFRVRFTQLKSLVLSVLGRAHPAALYSQNGRLCCVLNWQGEETNWHSACAELVEHLNRAMWEALGFRFQCVVGRMHHGVAELGQAQRELEQAVTFRKLLGIPHGEILFYDGILQTKGVQGDGAGPALEEEIVMLVGKASPFYDRKTISFAELRGVEVMCENNGGDLRNAVNKCYEAAGVAPNIVLESTTGSVMGFKHGLNRAVSFAPIHRFMQMCQAHSSMSPGLQVHGLRLTGPRCTWVSGIAHRPVHLMNPATEDFYYMAKDYFERLHLEMLQFGQNYFGS